MTDASADATAATTIDALEAAGYAVASDGGDAFDRLFGDDVLAREREERRIIRLRPETRDHDVVLCPDLPEAGYDHAAQNEAWNRRALRGGRGDRRSNRGGPGRR